MIDISGSSPFARYMDGYVNIVWELQGKELSPDEIFTVMVEAGIQDCPELTREAVESIIRVIMHTAEVPGYVMNYHLLFLTFRKAFPNRVLLPPTTDN